MANGDNKVDLSILENPLSSDQLDELRDSLVSIGVAKNQVLRMREAGIDVTEQLSRLEQAEKDAKAILQVYDTR